MFSSFFHSFIYAPLYNGLVLLIDTVPYADVGVAVILLTVLVKLVLLPLAQSAIRSQILMNAIKPELDEIREKHKDDKQEQARMTMELYREKGINPFSIIVPLIIQIPIILGLYWVFYRGGLPNIHVETLYPFVPAPNIVNMHFLGLIDMGARSIVLAVLAGLTQFVYTKLSFPKPQTKNTEPSFKDDLAKSMHLQMRYVMPVIIGVIAYSISAAIALYWTTSNLFMIGQEIFVRRRLFKKMDAATEVKAPTTQA